MKEKTNDKWKLLLIILIGSLVIAIGYYFISPYIKIFNGIYVELNELVNKYYVSDDSNYLLLIDEDNCFLTDGNNDKTFNFTYEEGLISSTEDNFIVLTSSSLRYIEGGCYFYDYNEEN